MNEMVEIENLSKQYQEFSLDHISFSIPGGSIMGFIGQNGAGKTTTIKLILNLVRKDSGTVKLFGLDHLKSEREIKEQIGVVLDEACFYDRFTAGDVRNIMRCMYQNWDDQLFSQLIKKFKLSEKIQIKEFSKGMKMEVIYCNCFVPSSKTVDFRRSYQTDWIRWFEMKFWICF